MSSPGRGFLDSKTIIAIAFSFGLLVMWQSHIAKKYPKHFKKGEAVKAVVESPKTVEPQEAKAIATTEPPKETLEKWQSFDSKNVSFEISNYGMGFRNVHVKKYTDRKGNVVVLSKDATTPLFGLRHKGELVVFNIERKSERELIGTANIGDVTVRRTLEIDAETYSIKSSTVLTGNVKDVARIEFGFDETVIQAEKAFALMPTYDNEQFYVQEANGDTERNPMIDEDVAVSYRTVSLVSLDKHYFSQAIIDNSDLRPDVKMDYNGQKSAVSGALAYDLNTDLNTIEISQKIFLGPKEVEVIGKVDERLKGVIDFGWFNWFGHLLLKIMKWFYGIFGNWGFAIIMLTLLVRLILLPLNVMSFKSMKKMQVIQPKLKAIKEKYKDDREALNRETMLMMKESGANPLGGCLPMLLQFPVFIALFQVLGNSIELYQAPFIWWITDLSKSDPYFVLPVIMAVAMTLQQRLTPSAADASQKKMMMMVTVIFSVFLVFYPSGLALYIVVGSIFTIIQQAILLREKVTHGKPVAA